MRRIRLTTAEQEQLEHTVKTTSDRRLRERCQAVLMASRGRKRQRHRPRFGGARTTVAEAQADIRNGASRAYTSNGRQDNRGASQRPWPRRSSSWVKDGPLPGCGLDRANWTYEELATYLYQAEGDCDQAHGDAELPERHGIRPYRPTYWYLRGDPRRSSRQRGKSWRR